jgi:hypothetical protein
MIYEVNFSGLFYSKNAKNAKKHIPREWIVQEKDDSVNVSKVSWCRIKHMFIFWCKIGALRFVIRRGMTDGAIKTRIF